MVEMLLKTHVEVCCIGLAIDHIRYTVGNCPIMANQLTTTKKVSRFFEEYNVQDAAPQISISHRFHLKSEHFWKNCVPIEYFSEYDFRVLTLVTILYANRLNPLWNALLYLSCQTNPLYISGVHLNELKPLWRILKTNTKHFFSSTNNLI